MRIITSFGNKRDTVHNVCTGVQVTPSSNGDHFEVVVRGHRVIARVRAVDFATMVERGDARHEAPFMVEAAPAKPGTAAVIPGRTIYRCHVTEHEGNLWLVPEVESCGILLFYKWDAWLTYDRKLETQPGSLVVSHVEDSFWKKHWNAIVMMPGSTFTVATYEQREVKVERDFFWRARKPQFETVEARLDIIELSASGDGLSFTSEFN